MKNTHRNFLIIVILIAAVFGAKLDISSDGISFEPVKGFGFADTNIQFELGFKLDTDNK